jgi:hypothetical protein
MAERIRPVPAVKLRKATTLAELDERIRSGVGIEALLADPIPETIVLPPDWQYSSAGDEFTVELSTRGATGYSYFLHLVVEPRPSALAAISFSQIQVNGPAGGFGGSLPRVDWGFDDWVRWSITVGRGYVSYLAAKHPGLLDPFVDSRSLQGLYPPYRVRAIILGANDLDSLSIAEVRLWDGSFFGTLADQLEFLGGRRLDGREAKLVGYWRLAEGEGTRVMDSSRFGNHGTLTGGEWLAADQSGLQLECSFEVARQRREELHEQCQKIQKLKDESAGLAQQNNQLRSHIGKLQQEQTDIENRKQEIEQELASEKQDLEREFAEWKTLIEDGGKVGLDDFSASVAAEVQQASDELIAGRYDLHFTSVDTTDSLLNEGRSLVIVALVGSDLHIRIFDAGGGKVLDKAEKELVSGETLTALKRRLTPLPPVTSLSEEDKQKIIIDATSIAGYERKSPYRLQGVGFEVKMLPVQKEGEEDFMVTFPQPEDEQIQPGQLSTLSLSFEPRPPSPPRTEKAVPDVRGYTELVARRLLGQAGFRVDVLDQATEKDAEIDRVISQEPAPGTETGLNRTVILLLGRASGGVAQ